jgi:hypothetical protein
MERFLAPVVEVLWAKGKALEHEVRAVSPTTLLGTKSPP